MKINWNKTTALPEVTLEEEDFLDAQHLEEMLNGAFTCHKCGNKEVNNGWKVLKGYLDSQRIILEEKIKGSLKRTSEETMKIQVAKLVGFDHFLNLPEKVVQQAKDMREELKEKNNDEPEPNPYGD